VQNILKQHAACCDIAGHHAFDAIVGTGAQLKHGQCYTIQHEQQQQQQQQQQQPHMLPPA